MKLFGWAIALAAAGLTPAPAVAQAAAAPQAAVPVEAAPESGAPANVAIAADPAQSIAAQTPAPSTPQPEETNEAAVQPQVAPFTAALPDTRIGRPIGGLGIQEQVTGIGREAASFHNNWLLLLCVAISLFVLGLLVYTMIRFRRSAHPVPSRTSHNTTIEVIWTLVPVLILVAIAIPSIQLLRHQYSPPPADLTVKVIGNQWYWTYQYPDNGDFEIVSNMLKERADVPAGQRFRTDADGPPLLAVDERMVIPAGKVVKFIVTSNDVIHAFWVPAFWNKIDAMPGQLNEIWAKVDRPGVYFGNCTELCGARHAYMPIAVEVVTPAQYAAWVASKGGTMPGRPPAPTPDSTGASPASVPAVPAAAAPQRAPAVPADAEPAVPVPVTNQSTASFSGTRNPN
jgi:cytochrome c oxidase subunit 2